MPDTTSILYQVGTAVKSAIDASAGSTDSYTETSYTDGVLTSLTKYASQGGLKLETKTFTYTDGQLTQVLVQDGSDVTTLTQTIAYDGDGNVSSITKDYA